MKFLIVFAALVAVALAAPRPNSDAVVNHQTADVHESGFTFDVETSDGFKHNAAGDLKDAGSDHEAIVVHGSYSYIGDDGQTYTITYTADENGFQPQGDHLPVPPEA